MAIYMEHLGGFTPDNLIAGNDINLFSGTGVFASGGGVLLRGTVLGINADGKLGVLGGSGLTAYAILCDNTDATGADTVAEIYLTGQFNRHALHVAEGYTMTTADETALRNGGIYLENSVQL